MDRMTAYQEGMIAALAMHRYFLANNRWPATIDELVPQFVIEIPADIINGEFIKFRIGDNGPIIYSVGNDRDDDGGKPAMREDQNGILRNDWFQPGPMNERTRDGDAILWPTK